MTTTTNGCKTKYIIVKYVQDFVEEGITKVPIEQAAHPDTYTAKECGVSEKYFTNLSDAKAALEKMSLFNPTVNYGVMEVQDTLSVMLNTFKKWWNRFAKK